MQQETLFKDFDQQAEQPVTCLGMTFPNDAARREHFRRLLAEKLKDPAFRAIEGFPIGTDEAILSLSDPPYYCACPNPWIDDFIREWETQKPARDGNSRYEREPFASDVSEGKNDPIYNAHSYHTKVPHKAIMRYILHYTEPGDIVFDGFCGTGMTGVAAQMCGDIAAVRSLGYLVDEKTGEITDPNAEDKTRVISHLGARKAVLNDLSPAATFIAYNYNTPVDVAAFEAEAKRLLAEVEEECGWMYETQHVDAEGKPILGTDGKPLTGTINYVVWSDVFICPNCHQDVVFWDAAVDSEQGEVRDDFPCPHCNTMLNKRNMERAKHLVFDDIIGENITQAIQVPVVINYAIGTKRYEKKPDEMDLEVIRKIDDMTIPYWFPRERMMEGRESRRNDPAGITHVHHFYTKKSLYTLAAITVKASLLAKSLLLSLWWTNTKMYRYRWAGGIAGAGGGPLAGTLYIPSIIKDLSILESFKDSVNKGIRKKTLLQYLKPQCISTNSFAETRAKNSSFDYIFLDPPFGANIDYSELNSLWEAWLKVMTNNGQEAIVNDVQKKDLLDYKHLMSQCFAEAYRLLKPGRWMTVEFSNTSAAVWNSIQSALSDAGFIVANVSALDKKQGSFKAVTTPTAVKQDLIISAYKPDSEFETRFQTEAMTEDGVWDFIRNHLEKLPVSKLKNNRLLTVPERDPRILYDQVVAYYFRCGFTIPISAHEFQEGLAQRFDEMDGMYFLPEQLAEYQKQRAKAVEPLQGELFVSDEASAIDWLRIRLKQKPQTYQSINPDFMQQLNAWNKYETPLELKTLLEQNFLCYDGNGPVPATIHAYLSTNYHDLRNLAADDEALKAKAMDLWYVPDPSKTGEMEKLREKALMREFEQYKSEKKLRNIRLEALRTGFRKCYESHDYATIVAIGKKLPSGVIDEDDKLQRYYDRAQMHLED